MRLNNIHSTLYNSLIGLRSSIIQVAQAIYDNWENDDNGGICDEISSAIMSILSDAGINVIDGGHDGDDHAYTVAYNDNEAFSVDIPYYLYEIGGGYNWRKINGVQFTVDDVVIDQVDRPNYID